MMENEKDYSVPITEKDVTLNPWIQEIKDKVLSPIEEGILQYSLIGLFELCGGIDKFTKEKNKEAILKERERILDLIDDLKYNTPSSKHPDVNSTILKQKIIMEDENVQNLGSVPEAEEEETSEDFKQEETVEDGEEEKSEDEETSEEEVKEEEISEDETESEEETSEEDSEESKDEESETEEEEKTEEE